MKARILTAALGIPALFLVLFSDEIITDIFIAIAALIGAYELLKMTEHTRPEEQVLFIIGLAIILSTPLFLATTSLLVLFTVLLVAGGLVLWWGLFPAWFLGILYLGIPLACVISFRHMEQGIPWILIFLMATWCTDTMALFGGRAFGRTPLSSISPNKTREGTAIGILFGFLGVLLTAWAVDLWDYPLTILLAAGLLPPLAVIGDLIESKIKRTYGKKDSGALFPGHGGMLDRIDSLLLTAPALWLLVILTA